MAYTGSSQNVATEIMSGHRHDRIPNEPSPIETSLTQKMLSAISGSILTSLLVTPLDVVRVRLQAQTSPSPLSSDFIRIPSNTGITACCREVFWLQNKSEFCLASTTVDQALLAECAADESKRRTINSTLDGIRKIARNEGITTLWRGLSPTLMMAVPGNVIYFAGYDWLRTNQHSPIKTHVGETYAPLIAGSISRVAAAVVVGPVEMLRTRMQASHPSSTGAVLKETVVGLREMVAENGYRSLWRGLTLTMWRDVPFSAFYWWGYEWGRERLHDLRGLSAVKASNSAVRSSARDQQGDHTTVLIDSFISGAAAGAIASVVTTPFDVGKTRQQTVKSSKGSALRPEYGSMPQLLTHIFKTEGMAGLFKGWVPRCMKVAPACAIMISSYELGKKMAGGMNERKDV